MNIKSITCPSCGGTLNIENVNQSLLYCQYCGTAIQLETNRNKGYDMEHGRLDARAEMADKVLESIEKIKDVLIKNSKAESEMKELPSVIYENKSQFKYLFWSDLKEYIFKGFLKGLGVCFLGGFVIVCISSLLNATLLNLISLPIGLAPLYFPIIGAVIMIKKQIALKEHISRCEAQLEQAKKDYEETNDYIAKNAEVNIPPRFRQPSALTYITKGLKAREFVSLEQALFRCEEAMVRDEVLDRYREF